MPVLLWFVGTALMLAAIGTGLWRRSSLAGSDWGPVVAYSFGAGTLIALGYSLLTYFGQPYYYPPEWVRLSMRALLWPERIAFGLVGQSNPGIVLGLVPWSIALQLSLIFLAVAVGVRLLLMRREPRSRETRS